MLVIGIPANYICKKKYLQILQKAENIIDPTNKAYVFNREIGRYKKTPIFKRIIRNGTITNVYLLDQVKISNFLHIKEIIKDSP